MAGSVKRVSGIRAVCATVAAWTLLVSPASVLSSAASDKVFTVGNYPVQAQAKNAVEAKQIAIRDGQDAALNSLIKRLVPVTAYGRLKDLARPDAGTLVDSVSVRSERNSSTEYVASMDIAFRPEGVRQLLGQAGLEFVETPSASVTLVLLYDEPQAVSGAVPPQMATAAGAQLWTEVWAGLDLQYGLVPLDIKPLGRNVHPDTVAMVIEGNGGGQRILAGEYGSDRVVIARLTPELSTKRLRIEMAGQDGVAPFRLSKGLRFDPQDFAYSVELAAVIAQGILEGRWKSVAPRIGGGVAAIPALAPGGFGPSLPSQPSSGASLVPVRVEFSSLAQWNEMRRVMETTDGVRRVDVNGLSPRAAEVAVQFSGSGVDLAYALENRGLRMVETPGGVWLLR